MNKNPEVTIKIKDIDEAMVIELYPNIAPNTVNNFINIIQNGYYNDAIFHRVIEGFMIQGGAVDEKLKPIKGEFKSNGFNNELKHTRGVISMARTSIKNSATSQFFIMHKDSPHLDGEYAGFGILTSGFNTLDLIATAATDRSDRPLVDIVIEYVKVDTFGIAYDSPVYA